MKIETIRKGSIYGSKPFLYGIKCIPHFVPLKYKEDGNLLRIVR